MITAERISKNMQAVKATGSLIEVRLAKALFKHGYILQKSNKNEEFIKYFFFKKTNIHINIKFDQLKLII